VIFFFHMPHQQMAQHIANPKAEIDNRFICIGGCSNVD
jgi:hypothetical protein